MKQLVISKILNMKDTGSNYHGRHLKSSIEYISNPDKTQNGRLVMGINCLLDNAFEQMRNTKEEFGKNDKRQGYHIVLSFEKEEADVDMVFKFAEEFVSRYLNNKYEAVIAVHDNTEHPHAHIVFNSVSYIDGRKYRYKKGDWEKEILPIVNGLCEEYGISKLELAPDRDKIEVWDEHKNGRFVWTDMIKRDIDACILQAATFESFIELLTEKEYDIKNTNGEGKYLAIKPMGMNRYRRCKSLGEDYDEDSIRRRIEEESILKYQRNSKPEAKIVYCKIKRYRRAKLSGIQKKYYSKLYRTNKLKKKPYSQAWKYRDDIRKLHKLQQQYQFLVRYDIHTMEEFAYVHSNLQIKKKELTKEKGMTYRAMNKCKNLFDVARNIDEVSDAQKCFCNGDTMFLDEHILFQKYEKELSDQGYSYEEVKLLEQHYINSRKEAINKENAVKKDIRIADSIKKDFMNDDGSEKNQTKEIVQERERSQPKR